MWLSVVVYNRPSEEETRTLVSYHRTERHVDVYMRHLDNMFLANGNKILFAEAHKVSKMKSY